MNSFCTHFSKVGFHIEVPEKNDEGDHVDDEDVVHPQGKFTAGPDAVDPQDQSASELDLRKHKSKM